MSSSQTLTQRIEASHRELRRMRRHFRRGTWITAIIGFGLLAVVAAYFCYGYVQISSFRDPNLLVSLVGNTVDQQIPQLRRTLQAQVENNATVWAEQASQQVLAVIPTARKELEDYAVRKTDVLIDELNVMGEKEFRRILNENRAAVEQALKDLEEQDELSEGAVVLLEEALEKEMQVSMQDQAQVLLTILSDVNKNFKKLHKGEDLSPEEQATCRALMIAKRLQKERFGDLRVEDLAPRAVTDAVEDLERSRLKRQAESIGAKTGEPASGQTDESEDAKDTEPEEEKAGQPEEKEDTPSDEQKADESEEAAQDKPEEEEAAQPEAEESSPAEDQKADEPKTPDQ